MSCQSAWFGFTGGYPKKSARKAGGEDGVSGRGIGNWRAPLKGAPGLSLGRCTGARTAFRPPETRSESHSVHVPNAALCYPCRPFLPQERSLGSRGAMVPRSFIAP